MSKKTSYERLIDQQANAGATPGMALNPQAPPATRATLPAPPPPGNVRLVANTLLRSAATATALVEIAWDPPGGVQATSYRLEIATNSAFPSSELIALETTSLSATAELATATTYYARVFAFAGGIASPASQTIQFTTVNDTTPAAQPTNLQAYFETPDLEIAWTNPTNANFRDVEVRIWDSPAKTTLYHVGYSSTGRYTWSIDAHRRDTSNNLDASVFVELRSRTWQNVINNINPPSTVATNNPPPAPTVEWIQSGFNSVIARIGGTRAPDFDGYLIEWLRNSVAVASGIAYDQVVSYEAQAGGVYALRVYQRDVFGQLSPPVVSTNVTLDFLTIERLREGLNYLDYLGNSSAQLKPALADNNVASGGQTYGADGGWNRWIRAWWEFNERIRFITLSMTPLSGNVSWYVRASRDGTNWTYYAGPVTGGNTLTLRSGEADARNNAVDRNALGNPSNARARLPSIIEARFVEVWLSPTTVSTTVHEFMPRRLVQAEDVEAETLSAISANLGTISAGTINSVTINSSTMNASTINSATVNSGTITGALIRTAASGARIELDSANGLRSFNAANTLQAQIRTSDGALTLGNGLIVGDATGLRLRVIGLGEQEETAIRWVEDSLMSNYPVGFVRLARYGGRSYTLQIGCGATIGQPHSGNILIIAERQAGLMTWPPEIVITCNDYLISKRCDIRITPDGMIIGTRLVPPTATFEVVRGDDSNGTAFFHGSQYSSLFNHGSIEDTFIRGGMDSRTVFLADIASQWCRVGAWTNIAAENNLPKFTVVDGMDALGVNGLRVCAAFGQVINGGADGDKVGLSVRLHRYGNGWWETSVLLQRVTNWLHTSPYIALHANGNVGVDTLAPGYKLHVNGAVAGTTFVPLSAEARKDDIAPLGMTGDDVLHRLRRLTPKRWKPKNIEPPIAVNPDAEPPPFEKRPAPGVDDDAQAKEGGEREPSGAGRAAPPRQVAPVREQIGFVAEEIAQAFPELVIGDNDGERGYDLVGLVAMLVSAVRHLADQVDALQRAPRA